MSSNDIDIDDERRLVHGTRIPTLRYCDQPYVVVADDGAWVCIVTTGAAHEGSAGQHLMTQRSLDQGATWQDAVALEPPDGPEASYAVLLKIPGGRIIAFYNHNSDRVPWVTADPAVFRDGKCHRVDSLGHFVYKYSDDHGKTWSQERYEIPQRRMAIDRDNADGGALLYFWNVGRPFIHDGRACVPLHKVGGFGEGFFTSSQGVLLVSDNLLAERDPAAIRWQTLPDGDHGVRAPAGAGPICEEHSFVELSDGSLFTIFRTVSGRPGCAYSRDHGRSWSAAEHPRYRDGRYLRHPRAANFIWKTAGGRYLYWFHNNATCDYGQPDPNRNPAWLSEAVEIDGSQGRELRFSQPEVLLYDDDCCVGPSYPDLIEDGGALFLSETDKSTARVHRLSQRMLDALHAQVTDAQAEPPVEPLLRWRRGEQASTEPVELPRCVVPSFSTRGGFEHDFRRRDHRSGWTCLLELDDALRGAAGCLVDARDASGIGWAVHGDGAGGQRLLLCDGHCEQSWTADRDLWEGDGAHAAAWIVDGGAKLLLPIIDGRLSDGGGRRPWGWGRFSPELLHCNGDGPVRLHPGVIAITIYPRALLLSELLAAQRSVIASATGLLASQR